MATNLLTDGSLEGTSPLSSWNLTNITGTIRTDTPNQGLAYARFVFNVTTAAQARGPLVSVTAGQVYSFGADLRVNSGTAAWTLQITWLDSVGASINTDGQAVSPTGSWGRFWISGITAPVGAVQAAGRVRRAAAVVGDAIDVDACMLTAGTYSGVYVPWTRTAAPVGGVWFIPRSTVTRVSTKRANRAPGFGAADTVGKTTRKRSGKAVGVAATDTLTRSTRKRGSRATAFGAADTVTATSRHRGARAVGFAAVDALTALRRKRASRSTGFAAVDTVTAALRKRAAKAIGLTATDTASSVSRKRTARTSTFAALATLTVTRSGRRAVTMGLSAVDALSASLRKRVRANSTDLSHRWMKARATLAADTVKRSTAEVGTFDATATFTADTRLKYTAAMALHAADALTALARAVRNVTADWDATGTLTASTRRRHRAGGPFASAATLAALARRRSAATFDLDAHVTLTAITHGFNPDANAGDDETLTVPAEARRWIVPAEARVDRAPADPHTLAVDEAHIYLVSAETRKVTV